MRVLLLILPLLIFYASISSQGIQSKGESKNLDTIASHWIEELREFKPFNEWSELQLEKRVLTKGLFLIKVKNSQKQLGYLVVREFVSPQKKSSFRLLEYGHGPEAPFEYYYLPHEYRRFAHQENLSHHFYWLESYFRVSIQAQENLFFDALSGESLANDMVGQLKSDYLQALGEKDFLISSQPFQAGKDVWDDLFWLIERPHRQLRSLPIGKGDSLAFVGHLYNKKMRSPYMVDSLHQWRQHFYVGLREYSTTRFIPLRYAEEKGYFYLKKGNSKK
jgi:hypothetical protein